MNRGMGGRRIRRVGRRLNANRRGGRLYSGNEIAESEAYDQGTRANSVNLGEPDAVVRGREFGL